MFSFRDIPYGPLKAHVLDLFVPEHANDRPLIVFVHGGAWRSEDKSDHAQLAVRIALNTACPVALPNYRLTPSEPQQPGSDDPSYARHPSHAEDVLAALTFLYEHTRGVKPQDITASATPQPSSTSSLPISLSAPYFHLIGHSCGAHILSSIFLSSAQITPSLRPYPDLLAAVHSVTMSEGIYDLDALIETFPRYDDWFVRNAFGVLQDGRNEEKRYARFATTTYPLHSNGAHIRWHVLHSRADTLVNLRQSEAIAHHLRELHDAIEPGRSSAKVFFDADSLTHEHNEMLKTDEYSDTVGKYIKESFA